MAPPPSSTSSSTASNGKPPPSPKKKGKKKKRKVQTVIPTNLTANIGEDRRKEMENEPEVFEKTSTAKKESKKAVASKSDETSSGSGQSAETRSLSTQSLPKQPSPRPSKLVYEPSKDKVIEYKIEVGKTYSQSSGTLSYDSVYVADAAKMNTFRATGVNVKHADVKVQTTKILDLNADQQIEQATPLDAGEYQKLIRAAECPPKAFPTPEYLYGRREKQLAKETIMEAIEEYFSNDRDDVTFSLQIQRRGSFPIISMKIKNL